MVLITNLCNLIGMKLIAYCDAVFTKHSNKEYQLECITVNDNNVYVPIFWKFIKLICEKYTNSKCSCYI